MRALSGPLVSAEYLCGVNLPAVGVLRASGASAYRSLRAPVGGTLGPASHPAHVFAVAVRPLMQWLGWRPPSPLHGFGDTQCYALDAPGADLVGLVVAPYGHVRSQSRAAIAAALTVGARWVLVTDGQLLRLIDGQRGHTRGFVDVDLDECADDEPSLAWLVHLVGPTTFVPDSETYLPHRLEASDAYGRRVCRALREGVGDALSTLTSAVAEATGRRRDLHACYADALTAVYRTLFLLFAEARLLVPMWHPVYRRGYSIEALGARLAASRPPRGTWAALQAIARLAHAGADSGDLRVTPFNGKLFAPSRAPLLDHLSLDDGRVATALDALCFTRASAGGGRQRIAYAELGVEELGSVYEGLLDLEPVRDADRTGPAAPAIVLRPSASAARKTTGSFYTPRAIADALVHDTLAPLTAGRSADEILSLRVLDPAMGSGAFLVSAGRFLASEWERALIAHGDVADAEISESDRAVTRRRIASRCLFGVDRNPMAVQLAQLSVWLATLAADRPLSFLDHHLVTGNSLMGASPLDVLARPPSKGRRCGPLPLDTLFEWSDSLVSVRATRHDIETAQDDSVDVVRGKEATLSGLQRDPELARWKAACDLWCAGWVPGGPGGTNLYHTLLDECLGRSGAGTRALDSARRASELQARALGCFHWPLEFPEVFLDAGGHPRPDGGFDAVVGNPPWEMLRADGRRDAAAVGEGEALVRFARDSGVYAWQGRGHANQFQLFVERALHVTRPGGRIGLIVPASLLTDEGSEALRRGLIASNQLDTVTVFENRRALFPIHRSVRFATVTAIRAGRTTAIRCRFGVADPAAIAATPEVTLTRRLVERLSGPGLAIPYLPTARDLRLVEALTHAHPALADEAGWHVTFGRELNATDDRDCFRSDPRPADLPVVEGRHLSPFRVDLSAPDRHADAQAARARLGARAGVDRHRLAYRDVASATNRTTLIAAIVPAQTVTVHTVFCLQTRLPLDAQRVLCALLNSYVANYLARRRVTTHVTTGIVGRLAVPHVPRTSRGFEELATAAATLERGEDAAAAALVQAAAAEAYGLSEEDLAHVLATFPLVPSEERAAVMSAFVSRRPQRSWR